MKLKDIFSKSVNKKTNQVTLCARKRVLDKLNYEDIDEVLDMEVKRKMSKW